MQLKNFETQIKKDIPLAKELEFEFVSYEGNKLYLKAPYLPNKNDKQTVFAGSQASLALLAGWSLSTLYFETYGVSIVAAVKTEMHYKKPIENNFIVRAKFLDDESLEIVEKSIEKKGRAKVHVSVELLEEGSEEVKAVFSASYFLSV